MLSTEHLSQINLRIREFQSNLTARYGVKITLGISSVSFNEASPTIGNKTDLIMDTVAQHFEISLKEMKSKSRQRIFIDARSLAIYFIKEQSLGLTLSEIGRLFNIDHCTVVHAYKKSKTLIEVDAEFRGHKDAIWQLLNKA